MWISLAIALVVAETAPSPSAKQMPTRGVSAPASSDEVAGPVGRIDGRVIVAGDGGLVVVVVADGAETTRALPRTFEIEQRKRKFAPEAIVVEVGDFVAFPNRDKEFHNVFSVTPGSVFDMGLYQGGTSRAVRMATPGEVDVYCNIHEEMRAHVLVVPSHHYAVVDRDGNFAIENVPAGRRKVLVWSSTFEPRRLRVVVPPNGSVRLDQKLETPRGLLPHLRKNGEPYEQGGYGD
jgi:plastocyanin